MLTLFDRDDGSDDDSLAKIKQTVDLDVVSQLPNKEQTYSFDSGDGEASTLHIAIAGTENA